MLIIDFLTCGTTLDGFDHEAATTAALKIFQQRAADPLEADRACEREAGGDLSPETARLAAVFRDAEYAAVVAGCAGWRETPEDISMIVDNDSGLAC